MEAKLWAITVQDLILSAVYTESVSPSIIPKIVYERTNHSHCQGQIKHLRTAEDSSVLHMESIKKFQIQVYKIQLKSNGVGAYLVNVRKVSTLLPAPFRYFKLFIEAHLT